MASTTLTGIFSPGSPALAETLRTLTLDPSRTVLPGDTIRAQFTFSNLGGAAATGVRVRFSLPQGVEHVEGGDLVDDAPLPEGTRFVDPNGASAGDLEPNAQRRVTCTFKVDDTIEDGSELTFQAALLTDQTGLIASNLERLSVHSRPQLQNAASLVTLSAPATPKPGDVISVRATIRNSGSSSAHDIVLIMPTPEHTTYLARSTRIDGRLVNSDGEVFDYDSATIVSERLAPAQSVQIEYQATIDTPLLDGTRIRASGTVGARGLSEFAIQSAEIVVASPVDFEGEETQLTVLSDDVVTPGMRVPMVLRAMNSGTGIAERLQLGFILPPGLMYAPGSAHVDGQPVSDDSIEGLVFSLGSLPAGRMAEVGIAATVAVPQTGETVLPVGASLRWKTGERNFSRRLAVRVAPRFGRARNYVAADRGAAQAREDVTFTVHVYNDGTAPESDVRLRLVPGLYLTDLRVSEGSDDALGYDEPLALGVVHPHHERIFTVHAKIASKVPDRSTATLGVILEHADGAVDLGTATVVVRSRPMVDRVEWELASNESLRPNRTIDLIVRVHNGGSDVLRDARLALTLPPEVIVERAVDARRDREGIAFADVMPESVHEARLTLRLLHAVAGNRRLALDGWLHGRGISPVQFPALEVPTHAEAQFAQSSQLVAIPGETVNAGERLYYEVRLRNDGDGPAERLTLRVVPTNLAVYMPSSTTINGMPVPDDAGASQLWSARGLVLADVNPTVELRLRWEMIVMAPLPAGTPLDTRAVLEWGEGTTFAIAAPTVRVQAQPSLTESIAGTPISIARLFPSGVAPYEPPDLPEAYDAIATPSVPDVRPALEPAETYTPPLVEEAPPRAIAEIVAENAERLPSRPEIAQAPEELPSPVLYVDFTPERLANVIKMLDRSDSAGGLVQHLFAMRMFFPENALDAPQQLRATFATASRAMRAPLERLFVRLRMPRLSIAAKDLEDRESRDALMNLLNDIVFAPSAKPQPPAPGTIRIEGQIELDVVRSLMPELEATPIGSVTPWLVNAQLLGTTIYNDVETRDVLERYRAEMLNVLIVLNELPLEEFHRVLTSSVNRTLDQALAQVLDALRNAAHIAVD